MKLIPLKSVMSKVYNDINITEEIDKNKIIDWISESILFLNNVIHYKKIIKEFTIKDYKIDIPCDAYQISNVEYNNNFLKQGMNYDLITSNHKLSSIIYMYVIRHKEIHFTFTDKKVKLHYKSLNVDDSGDIVIIDDQHLLDYIVKYVNYKIMYPKFYSGSIPMYMYQMAEQEYKLSRSVVQSKFNTPTDAQFQNIMERSLTYTPDFGLFYEKYGT